jgi:rhomboid protease GluP
MRTSAGVKTAGLDSLEPFSRREKRCSLVGTQVRYYRNALRFSQGTKRFSQNKTGENVSGWFGNSEGRPKVCPACGALVGSTGARCYQCGASTTFSLAAASRSLGKLMPSTAPVTYGILSASCLLYLVSLLATLRETGSLMAGGIFNIGGISGNVLQRLGASLPLFYNLQQPWRFVTAIFLHGSLLHIGFNMWVLMDVGPQIEELYGSARYLFIYVITGIGGYILSSYFGHFSVGGSGGLLGLVGVLLALTMGRQSAGMKMLRGQLIRWLVYIVIWGFLVQGVDNMAHLGGFLTGFALGKILTDRPPATASERKRAYAMGWIAAVVVIASFAMAAVTALRPPS